MYPDVALQLCRDSIVILTETHCSYTDNPSLPGFSKPVQNIRAKSKNATKHYGGIAVFVKEEIRDGVKFLPITNSEYMWFRLDKTFFHMSHDIYVVAAYNSNSSFAETNINIFEAIENDAAKFSSDGSELLFCADVNGYTACEHDYCIDDNSDVFSAYANDHIPYIEDIPLHRNNMDSRDTNSRGDNFIDFLKATRMRILNGRVFGDTLGNFTCYSHTGSPSVIDYMASSIGLLSSIKSFTVNELTEFSIHCSLSVCISTGQYLPVSNGNQTYNGIPKFKWSGTDSVKFLSVLQKPNIINDLNTATDFSNYDQNEINSCAIKFESILTNSAKSAGISHKPAKKRKSNCAKKKPFKSHKPWFNGDCIKLKNLHKKLSTMIRKNPFNLSLVSEIRKIRRLYKTCKNSAKRAYTNNIWDNLNHLEKSNPRKFWKLFSDLKGLNDAQKENPVPMSEWIKHFSDLLNGAFTPDQVLNTHIESYIAENREKIFNELDFTISIKEVQDAIFAAKLNKAAGVDGLLNEMLKAGSSVLLPYLHKLFNAIFTSGNFPNSWRTNTLSPLHKKGDTHTPGNYRGIAVSTCISKLFLSILQKRLCEYSYENNLIPDCQLGYKKKASTADHILTLKNLIDKYILRASRSCLYACFVDFKSAFDTVWRRALLYKLIKLGISNKFITMIESLYSNVYYCVKLNGVVSDKISSNVGVKQGCVLSPLLFNLFLSDLPDIFDSSCDPVDVLSSNLSCLMFADDLVILSESAKGLQNALDKLNDYCTKWGLTVNTSKTKVIIFNKGGHKYPSLKFNLNGANVDIVQSYCYLGIIFSSCGSFNRACDALMNKALKAFYKFKQIHPSDNVPLALKLFDTLVTPIATYCGSIWGVLCTGKNTDVYDLNFYDKAPLEKLNIKLCKYLLGVNKFSVNHAVRGELGRYPMLINVLDMCTKFKKRLFALPDENLMKKSYLELTESLTNTELYDTEAIKNSTWHSRVNNLTQIGLGDNTKLLLQNIYSCLWNDLMNNQTCDNKLRTYAKYKKEFELENYIITIPLSKRRMFTKLRISSHSLAIEKGRHKKIPHNDYIKCDFCSQVKDSCTCNKFKYHRLCFNCNVVEDEKHFMCHCPVYDQIRSELLKDINSIFNLDSSDNDIYFITLMNCAHGDSELSLLICNFVNNCFKLRTHYIEPLEENATDSNEPTYTRSGRLSRPRDRLIESIGLPPGPPAGSM